eukprot:CAMPEP_0204328580 /NCGR_PEP_ID=MMETSP0469-20131031/13484_1 /ASSEMBLY_ACC=CAM_ASM_000384 /TAXON_ID=2969 /ORGANISM="Oxyrrhis marina" /LENGTH=64 /DNA_ID=CAMNT_0051311007 /DNA_START=86 /DNA_END=277 /DNA_ORIENTATION=+
MWCAAYDVRLAKISLPPKAAEQWQQAPKNTNSKQDGAKQPRRQAEKIGRRVDLGSLGGCATKAC